MLCSISQVGYVTQCTEQRIRWVLPVMGSWLRREGACLGLLCFHLATSELLCLKDLLKSLCTEFGEEDKSYLVRAVFFARKRYPCSNLEVTLTPVPCSLGSAHLKYT